MRPPGRISYLTLPKLIVFDLDYTIWSDWIDTTYGPEFTYIKETNTLVDSQGRHINLFENITAIIATIHQFPDTKIAIASRTSAPDWARTAMTKYLVPEMDNIPLIDTISYFEMYPTSKINHFTALHAATGIDYSDMLFFDDEPRNREVCRLGVHFYLVSLRYGVDWVAFEKGLELFEKASMATPIDSKKEQDQNK
ncbi:magnesium-dependent phosphatase-1 [Spinellus fusiger]|nr:magnesium-dependent phosphatase-1 [Spinellus fusiger]